MTLPVYKFRVLEFDLVEPNPNSVSIPVPRCSHQIVCNSKDLYLFGGYRQNSIAYRELWQFNLINKKWTLLLKDRAVPPEVISSAVLLKGNILMVYGGGDLPLGIGLSSKLRIMRLDSEIPSLTKCKVRTQPREMYGQCLVLNNRWLYTIGGTSADFYSCEIYGLNLRRKVRMWKDMCTEKRVKASSSRNGQVNAAEPMDTNEAEPVPPPFKPRGRYGHKVAFHKDKFYILAGANMRDTYSLTRIPVFDLQTRTWEEVQTIPDRETGKYPANRRCFGGFQVKTETGQAYYVMSGYVHWEETFNDLWRLDVPSLQWTLVKDQLLPNAVYSHSTAITPQGKMYVFGGIKVGNKLTHCNEMYAGWPFIPKLSEICWEALCFYGTLVYKDYNNWKKGLQIEAIPQRFLDRLE